MVKKNTSVNQFIALAVAEKLSALETSDYLTHRAKHGDRQKYLNILQTAPNIEPEKEDQL